MRISEILSARFPGITTSGTMLFWLKRICARNSELSKYLIWFWISASIFLMRSIIETSLSLVLFSALVSSMLFLRFSKSAKFFLEMLFRIGDSATILDCFFCNSSVCAFASAFLMSDIFISIAVRISSQVSAKLV